MNELRQAIEEITRELAIRRVVYPRLIEQGRLTAEEASRRSQALRHALYWLDKALREMTTPPRHTMN
jgi:hypothetical protein